MNRTTNVLEKIIERKLLRLDQARVDHPLALLREAAKQVRRDSKPHAFRRALQNGDRVNVIAEIKRASPSKGVIKEDFEPSVIAEVYVEGGAAALSVLTEQDYFGGSLEHLRAVRHNTSLPILRKDFVVDEYQLYEAAKAGADAVLLIVALLSDQQLGNLRQTAEEELSMDALVEVHSAEELQRARRCGATLVGVNNRDLHTFEVSLDVSVRMADAAGDDIVLVSESGIGSAADIRRLRALGYQGFLVGETLMRASDPAQTLRALIRDSSTPSVTRVKICGITNVEDAITCVGAGADMLGFNFCRLSPRYIDPEEARKITQQLPPDVMSVGIFVNEESPQTVARIADTAGVAAIQLHGDETPAYCQQLASRYVIKAVRVRDDVPRNEITKYGVNAILLDAFSSAARGGTGQRFDWSIARQARRFTNNLFLAGGLSPENITEAINAVHPYAVDVCSGVEISPGRKDENRVRQFVAAVRQIGHDSANEIWN